MLPEAAGSAFDDAFKGTFRDRNRAGKTHVPGSGFHIALGHISHHRGHQRIAQRLSHFARQRLDPDIVLAQSDVRPALLGAAHRNDDGGFAVFERSADLCAGHVVQKNVLLRGTYRRSPRHRQNNQT